MIKNPKTHIYCGDGKGKTTAAVGLAVRALGAKYSVLYCGFLKDGGSSEVALLRRLGAECLFIGGDKFTWEMEKSELDALKERISRFYDGITKRADDFDMVVLDEVLDAVGLDLLHESALLQLLKKRPGSELVLTGRKASEQLLCCADYVTEMKKIKHPFELGLAARDGVEK